MISFIHRGGENMASYRYRCAIPARELGAEINNLSADVVIFAKPLEDDVKAAKLIQKLGAKVIVDFCDDHLEWPFYRAMLDLADAVTCPTEKMAERLRWDVTVIPDSYEFDEVAPHCNGNNVLWFGNAVNWGSLARVLPDLKGYPLRVVSNVQGAIPWSMNTMLYEFQRADIVILPATKEYKSPNRALEAIRQGCFVVAEPHPSIQDFPGIWIGNLNEGIEWAIQNPVQAREWTASAQDFIREKYSAKTLANAWKKVVASVLISDQGA